MAPKYTAAGSVNYFALVHRGDPYAADMKRHKKFIPINLKAFRRNLQGLAESTRNNIDNKLAKLPLHLKLEIFKGFTLEERIIYDFLYKNVDVVLGLKEDTEDAD